jgi:hypothetical protein
MQVESRSSLLRRIEWECEEAHKDEEKRRQAVEKGGSYYTEQELAEIENEAAERTQQILDDAFGNTPEENYYLDAI